ncbi:MAG: hypothetical protein ACOCRX_00655 [Candidatus Woesearchaeota archaeon]
MAAHVRKKTHDYKKYKVKKIIKKYVFKLSPIEIFKIVSESPHFFLETEIKYDGNINAITVIKLILCDDIYTTIESQRLLVTERKNPKH